MSNCTQASLLFSITISVLELVKEIPVLSRNFKYLKRLIESLLAKPVEANLIDKFGNETYNVKSSLSSKSKSNNGIVPVTIL